MNRSYCDILNKNPAIVLASNLKTKSGLDCTGSYNWIDLRKKLINSDGKYSFESCNDSRIIKQIHFPQASFSGMGNRFYIKAKDFEAFCTTQAQEFFDQVKKLSLPEYIIGWNLRGQAMTSLGDHRYVNFKSSSRLVGYPLNDNRPTQQAYVLQMGDRAMDLRYEFERHVLGMYTPYGVTTETITLAGIFHWVYTGNDGSNLYSEMLDGVFDHMFAFDFRYRSGDDGVLDHLRHIHKEHETLVRVHSLKTKSDTDVKAFRELYLRVYEIMHDRASRVADSVLVGVYKPHQSGFNNVCSIINTGNYDLDQAIEIAVEANVLSKWS